MKTTDKLSALLMLLLVLTFPGKGFSQERCGTVEYARTLYGDNVQQKQGEFESWLTRKIQSKKSEARTEGATFQIPVVVHIIHKGEAIGVGSNISDTQVQSQIRVLNKDFNRLNADTVNTPSEFLSVAGKTNVEFVLARQSPDGLATTGIVRVKGSQNTWSTDNNTTLKALSYWPAEDYLNLWVTDLSNSLLGYAQFPISSLAGLSGDDNRLTDGVVVDYMAFGSADDGTFSLYSSFNKGRAATHEIGHFLGLRHIWGDDNGQCGGSGDYVSDTPDQGDYTSGCPTQPYVTCSNHTMFQNYMDYTNDNCMNLFTQGQVSRIETVLNNSPRRASLSSSHGLVDPVPLANDMGIQQIVSPAVTTCTNSVQPVVIVKNNGTNSVASTELKVTLNNTVVETKTFNFNPALAPGETSQIEFSLVAVVPGNSLFQFDIVQTNDVADAKSYDNHAEITTRIPNSISLPLAENFDLLPSTWEVQNPDGKITWAVKEAANSTTSNKAAYLNYYQYSSGVGEVDRLITPIFDLTNATSPYLTFDVAYSYYQNKQDGLKVLVSGCSSTEGQEVYSKFGSGLSTASSTSNSFVPSGPSQWRKEIINLHNYIGRQIQLIFQGTNAWGNNLYIDNIRIVESLTGNLALRQVLNISPVQCNSEVHPVLLVENLGSSPLNTFKIKYAVNNDTVQTTSVTDLNLLPGEKTEAPLPGISLSAGENTFSFEVYEPNELPDIHTEDNSANIKSVFNSSQDHVPLRENFDDDWSAWSSVNPNSGMKWKDVSTNYGSSLFFEAWNNTTVNDQAWLVSPVIDFSNTTKASVLFDLSYRYRDSASDELKIVASKDCGQSYNETLYLKKGPSIINSSLATAWSPSQPTDWERIFINLDSLAGEANVRIAFVFTNASGNNIYLDNIEFYTSDDPQPYVPENLYKLFRNGSDSGSDYYVSFNLATRQPVQLDIVDVTGQQIAHDELPDVLNQTFRIPAGNRSSGVYILRMLINNQYYADRIFLSR